jgi:hypothetical protein
VAKDTPTRAFFPGYVVPVLLGVLVIVNLLTHTAYWPARRGMLMVFTDVWRVSGTILLEVGLAAGLFALYVLANDDRREHLAQPVVGIAVLVAIVGLALFGYGFLV